MHSEYELLYKSLLEKGELRMVSPKMTGDWEKDKKLFTKLQQDLEKLLG